jgi:hypothetical protein
MKNQISKLLIFFFSITTFAGYSQSKVLSKHEMKIYTTDTSYDEIVNEFFEKYSSGNIKPAIEFLFITNPWLGTQEKINLMSNNLNTIVKQLGNYQFSAFITKKSVGPLVLCSYMVIYDRQPLRFTFTFYKPKDKWLVYNFEYDDHLVKELKEAAGVHRLYENMPFK